MNVPLVKDNKMRKKIRDLGIESAMLLAGNVQWILNSDRLTNQEKLNAIAFELESGVVEHIEKAYNTVGC